MTITETPAVAGAVETVAPGTISSHLHPEGSFEVSDHVVPIGREEVWRFTPLKRLRGLHQDVPLTGTDFKVSASAAPEVVAVSVPASDPIRGTSGLIPRDRVSARAWAAAESLFVVDIPAETSVEQVTTVTFTGLDVTNAIAGHLVIRIGAFSKATVVVQYEGSATLAENVEIIVGDGANLTVVTVQDWADDAVHHSTPTRPRRSGRHLQACRGHLRRRRGAS